MLSIGKGLAIAAAIMALLALAACGSDEDDNGGSAGAVAQATKTEHSGPLTDREQISALVKKVQADFRAQDAAAICAAMTPAAKAQVTDTTDAADCTDGFAKIFQMNRTGNKTEPTIPAVVAIRINGNRAVVTTRERNRSAVDTEVVRQAGKWKIGSLLTDAAANGAS